MLRTLRRSFSNFTFVNTYEKSNWNYQFPRNFSKVADKDDKKDDKGKNPDNTSYWSQFVMIFLSTGISTAALDFVRNYLVSRSHSIGIYRGVSLEKSIFVTDAAKAFTFDNSTISVVTTKSKQS